MYGFHVDVRTLRAYEGRMSARKVITAFGGIRPTAEKLGHKNHTTVQGWWERDVIPARHQSIVLREAKRLRIPIKADDVIPIVGALSESTAA